MLFCVTLNGEDIMFSHKRLPGISMVFIVRKYTTVQSTQKNDSSDTIKTVAKQSLKGQCLF